MRTLLVGGPADGKWLELKERDQTIEVVDPRELGNQVDPIRHEDIPHFTYRICTYHAQDGSTIRIMRLNGMTPSEAARLLMEHYFPKDALAKAAVLAESREKVKPE